MMQGKPEQIVFISRDRLTSRVKDLFTGRALDVVRAEVGHEAYIRFTDVDNGTYAVTSRVEAVTGLHEGTTVLSSPDARFDESFSERDRILWQAYIEQKRFRDCPLIQDDYHLDQVVKAGYLLPLVNEPILGYRRGNIEYPLATQPILDLLREITRLWQIEIASRGFEWKPDEVFLVITSTVRTVVQQQRLIASGNYPAAEKSIHCNGFAVDIAMRWLRDNKPQYFLSLSTVLGQLIDEGRITVIQEDDIGCFHLNIRFDWLARQLGYGTGLVSY